MAINVLYKTFLLSSLLRLFIFLLIFFSAQILILIIVKLIGIVTLFAREAKSVFSFFAILFKVEFFYVYLRS